MTQIMTMEIQMHLFQQPTQNTYEEPERNPNGPPSSHESAAKETKEECDHFEAADPEEELVKNKGGAPPRKLDKREESKTKH